MTAQIFDELIKLFEVDDVMVAVQFPFVVDSWFGNMIIILLLTAN